LKVLFINEVCGITSTGRICTDIADLLEEQGHEVKIAYGRGTVPEKYAKYAVKIGSTVGVYIHALGSRILDNTGFYSKKATREFIEWAKDYDPDVINVHNIHGYYIHIGMLFDYLKKCGKPIVWTLHDCWSFTGHCSHYDFSGCEKWKELCYKCPLKKEYPASVLADRSRLNYLEKQKLFTGVKNLHIAVPSEWLKNQVEQSFLKEYPVSVINNGIDLNIFKPCKSDFTDKNNISDKIILLGVANVWTEKKGIRDFITLSEKLDNRYKIVLVGDLRGTDIPQNIIHIEHTNSTQELAEIYSAADAFLNLTYEDTYPTTNLESLSCGTQVITYQTGGSVESVDGNNGKIIPKGDIEALINAVKKIEKKTPNNKYATEKFDKKLCFANYVKLFCDLHTG